MGPGSETRAVAGCTMSRAGAVPEIPSVPSKPVCLSLFLPRLFFVIATVMSFDWVAFIHDFREITVVLGSPTRNYITREVYL